MKYFNYLLMVLGPLAADPGLAMGERARPDSVTVSRGAGELVNGAFGNPEKRQKQRQAGWKIRPGGALASNVLVGRETTYLYASNFGLQVPEHAEITGLEIRVERRRSLFGVVKDASVRLVVGGHPAGENRADVEAPWTEASQEVSYGGPDDTWGLRLEPEQVNQTDFGVALKATLVPLDNPQTAQIQHITLIVYYES